MEWISVYDRVPNFINKKFVVKYEAGNYGETERYRGNQTDEQFKNVLVANDITHWLDETTPAQSGAELLNTLKNDYDDLHNTGYSKENLKGYADCIWDICLTLGKKEWFSENIVNHITKKIK